MAVTAEAIQKLKQMIHSGQVRPGDRLPREPELAAMLDLSRCSLREAVKALSLITSATGCVPTATRSSAAPRSTPGSPHRLDPASARTLHGATVSARAEGGRIAVDLPPDADGPGGPAVVSFAVTAG